MKIKFVINFLFIDAYICLGVMAMAYGNIHTKYDIKNRVYWHGPTNENKVALTFDDGPSEDTAKILDILKKFNLKATFFVVGKNVEKHPEIFKRLVQEGHIIGNHTYSHPFMLLKSTSTIERQIKKTEGIVKKFSDQDLFLLRTPYGVENPWVFKETKKLGYTIIKWSVSGKDWRIKNKDKIVKRIARNVQNGSIINLHDGRRLKKNACCRSTIKVLPLIIITLKRKGYKLVTVPELLGIKQNNLKQKI